MDWFSTFFDSDYLRVFGPFVEGDRARDEARDVAGLLGLRRGEVVLDLACGQGRHATLLRTSGLRVVGLDLSATLLAAARVRDDELALVRADMRHVPLADSTVDAVVNLFNAFGYFEDDADDLAVLREVARVVRPGGLVVQEVHHRDALVLGWEPRTTHPVYADGLTVTEDRDWDAVRGRHAVMYTLTSGDGEVRRVEHRLRVYTLTELVALHELAGLRVRSVSGDLVGGKATPQTPLGVIVSVAR